MATVNIEDALNKTPFVPFDIHIDSRKTVHVRHPDFLLFSESKKRLSLSKASASTLWMWNTFPL